MRMLSVYTRHSPNASGRVHNAKRPAKHSRKADLPKNLKREVRSSQTSSRGIVYVGRSPDRPKYDKLRQNFGLNHLLAHNWISRTHPGFSIKFNEHIIAESLIEHLGSNSEIFLGHYLQQAGLEGAIRSGDCNLIRCCASVSPHFSQLPLTLQGVSPCFRQ